MPKRLLPLWKSYPPVSDLVQHTVKQIRVKVVCEALSPALTSLTWDTNVVRNPLLALPRERWAQAS